MLLFFDTETTGLIDYKAPLEAAHQPRITQLAAILTDDTGEPVDEMNAYIKPDGWTVPPEITEITGITTERLEESGIPMMDALATFNNLKSQCHTRIGHFASFDKQMLAREAMAYGVDHDSTGLATFCTMKESRAICALPKNKAPKLAEAYRVLCGNNLFDVHDAMADARACMEIFFALRRIQERAAS